MFWWARARRDLAEYGTGLDAARRRIEPALSVHQAGIDGKAGMAWNSSDTLGCLTFSVRVDAYGRLTPGAAKRPVGPRDYAGRPHI